MGCGPIWFDEKDVEKEKAFPTPFGKHVGDSVFVQSRGPYIDIIDTDASSPSECSVVSMTLDTFRALKRLAVGQIPEFGD
jgi:hypothetical protein